MCAIDALAIVAKEFDVLRDSDLFAQFSKLAMAVLKQMHAASDAILTRVLKVLADNIATGDVGQRGVAALIEMGAVRELTRLLVDETAANPKSTAVKSIQLLLHTLATRHWPLAPPPVERGVPSVPPSAASQDHAPSPVQDQTRPRRTEASAAPQEADLEQRAALDLRPGPLPATPAASASSNADFEPADVESADPGPEPADPAPADPEPADPEPAAHSSQSDRSQQGTPAAVVCKQTGARAGAADAVFLKGATFKRRHPAQPVVVLCGSAAQPRPHAHEDPERLAPAARRRKKEPPQTSAAGPATAPDGPASVSDEVESDRMSSSSLDSLDRDCLRHVIQLPHLPPRATTQPKTTPPNMQQRRRAPFGALPVNGGLVRTASHPPGSSRSATATRAAAAPRHAVGSHKKKRRKTRSKYVARDLCAESISAAIYLRTACMRVGGGAHLLHKLTGACTFRRLPSVCIFAVRHNFRSYKREEVEDLVKGTVAPTPFGSRLCAPPPCCVYKPT